MKPTSRGRSARLGFALKKLREALGLTQEEFAERAGIHRTCPSDVERGTRKFGLMNIERGASPLAMNHPELFAMVDP